MTLRSVYPPLLINLLFQDVPGREAAVLFRYFHHLRPAVLRSGRDPHTAGRGSRVREVGEARRPAAPQPPGRLHV